MTNHNWLSSEPPTFERMQQTFSQMKKFCISQASVVTFSGGVGKWITFCFVPNNFLNTDDLPHLRISINSMILASGKWRRSVAAAFRSSRAFFGHEHVCMRSTSLNLRQTDSLAISVCGDTLGIIFCDGMVVFIDILVWFPCNRGRHVGTASSRAQPRAPSHARRLVV